MLLLCFTLIILNYVMNAIKIYAPTFYKIVLLCYLLAQVSMVHADAVMTDAVVVVGPSGLRGSVTSDLHTAQAVGAIASLHTFTKVFLAQIYTMLGGRQSSGGRCFYLLWPWRKSSWR